uniref:monocarboxylate transporter 4 n=1 Tax=Monopterus albus TaxID=43700 RepID=UPI0009B3C184|nr:monocarboxylate transporter 4-like [Monopterus albus]
MGGAVVDDGPTGVKAPDGGWGWAVLIGCFVITGFSYAFPKAVSVFFKELIREFGVGYSDTAWISSILLAMLYGTGPLCSVLVNKFGCRPVMMVGGLFASLGMILASFSTSIIYIYLCTGVITAAVDMKFSPDYDLQYQYGWRGGFLILGGILLNCCACGALMRPLLPPKKSQEEESAPAAKEEEKKPPPKKKKLLDFSVFKDKGFLIYTVAASIMVLGLFVPPVFVVSYAKELGYEDTKSALLLTILGLVDMFARPVSGLIAGMKYVRPRSVYLFSFAMIFNGCTDLIGSQANNYAGLVVFCMFFGMSYGMVGALQFEVLMAIVGTEKFSSAIGLVLLMEAIAVLVGPPGAGRLLDYTHQYMYVFLLAGCEVTLSAIVIALGNFLCISKKQEDPEAKMEMAVTASEREGLNHQEKDEAGEEDPKGKENGKLSDTKAEEEVMMVKEMGEGGEEENTETSL